MMGVGESAWRRAGFGVFVGLCAFGPAPRAQELEPVRGVELQPFAASARRIVEALDYLGAPMLPEQVRALEAALTSEDHAKALLDAQAILDARCIVAVHINPESRVKVAAGPAEKELVQQGWRAFLVKVHNEAGVTAPLVAQSPNAAPVYKRSTNKPEPAVAVRKSDIPRRFLDLAMFDGRPLNRRLSGLELEYRIVQIYSRDVGAREAKLAFNVGQGTQDLGFRNEVAILFSCAPAVKIAIKVIDHDGKPTMASFLIKDRLGRVYPLRSRRLAPDFFFHAQIYRGDGETLNLPPGRYSITFTRGPEYVVQTRSITVPDAREHKETFRLERWIHIAAEGWRSGDHHVHAAGCAHYESPTEGVTPDDMWRHILGEDLNVGCVLAWGPCWYAQKKFFAGGVHPLSNDDYVMRYDVEVSGFPSSHCGHLTLLRLKEDDYRGTTRIEEWPSWNLPVLQWAKEQGAVTGFSHSGFGLRVPGNELPSYVVPAFDGIGANEYIVDVTHGAVDFISTVDTPAVWELNIWYHTLNCGFRTRISGETDFPCIYGERVGLGRIYVKMPAGPLDFDEWVDGLRDGRSYVSDGMSHILDFTVEGVPVGETGLGGVVSQLELDRASRVSVTARIAARLDPEPDDRIRDRPLAQKPYWHLERARIGTARKVPVELIVNGHSVARREIVADGSIVDVEFDATIDRSSWVALRIFPSSHTNPVFVLVDDAPIRASRKSAQWCLESVSNCWRQKVRRIRASERQAAREAFDAATATYRKILAESRID